MLALTEEQKKLADEHYYLVKSIVGRCAISDDVDRDTLLSDCAIGLMKAASRYDPSSGVQFQTFAWVWIAGALKMSLRDHSRRKEHVVLMDGDTMPATSVDELDEVFVKDEARQYLSVLDDNEYQLVDLVFFQGMNVTEIGVKYNLSRFVVNEIYTSALQKMRVAAGLSDSDTPLFNWAS